MVGDGNTPLVLFVDVSLLGGGEMVEGGIGSIVPLVVGIIGGKVGGIWLTGAAQLCMSILKFDEILLTKFLAVDALLLTQPTDNTNVLINDSSRGDNCKYGLSSRTVFKSVPRKSTSSMADLSPCQHSKLAESSSSG